MDFYQKFQQCMQQKKPKQGLQHLQQHLKLNRNHAYGFFLAGTLLRDLGQWAEALCAFLEARRLDPRQSEIHSCLGVLYNQLQKPESAIQSFNTAYELSKDPGFLYNRALALLMAGRYQEGWQEYEWRIQVPPKSKLIYEWHPPSRLWQGQPFPDQTLVVYSEQGLGDDIQFCRYLPYLKVMGGTVIFLTSQSLLPLMSDFYGVDQVIGRSRATVESLKDSDWFVPLMSLPHLCQTTLDSIPDQTPYLRAPPEHQAKWQALLEPYRQSPGIRNIGFVYSSSNDKHIRSCPFPLWHPLFSLPGLQWFSVQKGDAATAVQKYAAHHPSLIDLSVHIDDFGDTAALLDQMDLLISIDTSVPHLAGALGKPAWLLLPYVVDWRWLLQRSDSPWYPSFRLFRQPAPGQWQPVMTQVRQALSTLR